MPSSTENISNYYLRNDTSFVIISDKSNEQEPFEIFKGIFQRIPKNLTAIQLEPITNIKFLLLYLSHSGKL